jgi:Mrp family chromosome partitioning ATPase
MIAPQPTARAGVNLAPMPELTALCKPVLAQLQSETPLDAPLVLGVTSVGRGEGRTTVAIGMALAAVAHLGSESRTLLVDGDVENPTLHLRCNSGSAPGLHEVVTGQCRIGDALVSVQPGVWFLPAGNKPQNATRYLKSLESLQVLTKLGEHFNAVIVDLPPLQTPQLGVLPPQLVSRMVMVVRSGLTRRADLEGALALVPEESLAAVMLNSYRDRTPRWLRKFVD